MLKKYSWMIRTFICLFCFTVLVACGKTGAPSVSAASGSVQSPAVSAPLAVSAPPALSSSQTENKAASDTALEQANLKRSSSNMLNIAFGSYNFTATLAENPSAEAFKAMLPMTVQMGDMNSNEKYYYTPEALPTNSRSGGNITNGDIMLYGSDCLVLFYESFSTSYSYTRLGAVDDPTGLEAALGSGDVTVTWSLVEQQ